MAIDIDLLLAFSGTDSGNEFKGAMKPAGAMQQILEEQVVAARRAAEITEAYRRYVEPGPSMIAATIRNADVAFAERQKFDLYMKTIGGSDLLTTTADAARAFIESQDTLVAHQKMVVSLAQSEAMKASLPDPHGLGGITQLLARDLVSSRAIHESLVRDPAAEMARLGLAQDLAFRAQHFTYSDALKAILTPEPSLAAKIAVMEADWLREPDHLAVFAASSSVADLLRESERVDAKLLAASSALIAQPLPQFETLSHYGQLLDAAGLTLPRPRLRRLSAAEKQQRIRARLKEHAEPTHVRSAKSLVHRYEALLREAIDEAMSEAYGEDWPQSRLPACNCKDLLKRGASDGAKLLTHADFAHYVRIMTHPQHFEEVFSAGFDDSTALQHLLSRARSLRAASHHGREFTPEDLRELRVTFRILERGLRHLTPDFEVEF